MYLTVRRKVQLSLKPNGQQMSVKSRIKSLLPFFFILLILGTGVLLRFYSITDRPMHSDEGVNYHFVKKMMEDGYYHYSHENYHGPTYFYLLYVSHSLFGSGELFHRLPAILSGVFVFISPVMLLPLLSMRAVLFPLVLLACSSSLIFYSRYSIHEMFLVLSCLAFLNFFFLWIEMKKSLMLVPLAICLGLLIATKETFIIFCFAACTASFCTYSPKLLILQLCRNWFSFIWGIFALMLVVVSFYSGFFQHSEGLRELFMGVQQWVSRGHTDTGHHKPYFYYAKMLIVAEPLAFSGVVPVLFYFLRNMFRIGREVSQSGFSLLSVKRVLPEWYRSFTSTEERLVFCSSMVALISFLVYSYVPYKTPWLVINIVAPSLFSFGLFAAIIVRNRYLYGAFASILFLSSVWYALVYNFESKSIPAVFGSIIRPVGAFSSENPYVYVQTTDGMVEIASDIIAYLEHDPEGRVLIAVNSYWPFPYYLREYGDRVGYRREISDKVPMENYGIMVLDKSKNFNLYGWYKRYIRLSGVQESFVYYDREKVPDRE
jgi:uncharacterized protein (TIGR03663 family)